MMERLQKLLAQAGIASRRHAEEMILAGRVRVNGKVVTELGTQVDPELDKVMVDNQPISLEPKAYIILNKPRGYISDRDETSNLKTALDLVPDGRRLFAAGRLDLMSEGMLFLTNDGALANKLTHPKYEHEKEYLALVYGTPDDKTIARLEKGIMYDGEWMRADFAERAGRNQDMGEAGRDETWLRIILHEGKKRQIRHMCAALGHAVKRLVRVRMGGLKLGNLKVGEWRKLSQDEVALLTKAQDRAAQRKHRPADAKSRAKGTDEQASGRDSGTRAKPAPRQDRFTNKNVPPRREDQQRRDSAPRRDGSGGKSYAPRGDAPPRRGGAPPRDEGPRRGPPPTRTSFSPGRGGSPRTGGSGSAPRRDAPAAKSYPPRRDGPPRRDSAPRRDGPAAKSYAPRRDSPPRRDSTPRRDVPAGKSFAPRRDSPPRRDESPLRGPPPTRTSFSPGRGGSPRTGGSGSAPRRDGPPRDDRKRNDGAGGGRAGFKPTQGSNRNSPPRSPKRNAAPPSRKPNDKRRDDE